MKMKSLLLILLLLPFQAISQTDLPSRAEKGVAPLNPKSQIANPKSTTRAVVVGISDYQDDKIPDLRFAHRDAEAFANFLRSPAGGDLDRDHLKLLVNEQATAGRIAEALDALVEQTKEGDQVIIYFSGHGDVERKILSQPGFLLCWDSPARVYMGGGTYSLAYLEAVVTTLSLQNKAKVTVITDACHAGKLAGSQIGGAQLTAASLARQFANEVKILSCQPNEFSLEGEQWGGGRGCFSYHLVDGLFGLADRNSDAVVTVGELDRYIEDHVTAEVAPLSQVPIVIGNRTERLATVDATLLAGLRSGKASQMAMLSAIESKGLEENVLATVDTTVRETYKLFKKALRDKVFFEPADACADTFFEKLMAESKLTRLHSNMRRNYAAALQDDAQQAINIWLKADVEELQCIGKNLKLAPIPRQLERAIELLGEEHYMYKALKSRQFLLEGLNLCWQNRLIYNPSFGEECLKLYRQSLDLEPNSALAYKFMMTAYGYYMHDLDSAEVCMDRAHKLAPNWVLPFTDFYHILRSIDKSNDRYEHQKEILDKAMAIDSTHGYVIGAKSVWLVDNHQLGEAITTLKKYEANAGSLYPCWYVNLGYAYWEMGHSQEAEALYKRAVQLDSALIDGWNMLGYLYNNTSRFDEAEHALKKAIKLNPESPYPKINLAFTYVRLENFSQAESTILEVIQQDSTIERAWTVLGIAYSNSLQFVEAEMAFSRALHLDSLFVPAIGQMGLFHFRQGNLADAESWFLKALSIDPKDIRALKGMAYVLTASGKPVEAIEWVSKVIELLPNYEDLSNDPNLAPLRTLPEWQALMKKYFPDQIKD